MTNKNGFTRLVDLIDVFVLKQRACDIADWNAKQMMKYKYIEVREDDNDGGKRTRKEKKEHTNAADSRCYCCCCFWNFNKLSNVCRHL